MSQAFVADPCRVVDGRSSRDPTDDGRRPVAGTRGGRQAGRAPGRTGARTGASTMRCRLDDRFSSAARCGARRPPRRCRAASRASPPLWEHLGCDEALHRLGGRGPFQRRIGHRSRPRTISTGAIGSRACLGWGPTRCPGRGRCRAVGQGDEGDDVEVAADSVLRCVLEPDAAALAAVLLLGVGRVIAQSVVDSVILSPRRLGACGAADDVGAFAEIDRLLGELRVEQFAVAERAAATASNE